uniref:NADH-ubiquinone oxidoreductase chain 2 n=1 Tax=Myllocerinus aurolineatus TaxID=2527849 RepID=A0A411LW00_9CUCU|nr:NADH dehydrogenase subunit 2 [Myllocerinus aurolineatus]QBF03603.1 NADH dehydrogenase subunit 2 [Myllocerinus aurolineatus]
MMKLYKILFLNATIIGSLIAMSACSFYIAWVGLEINLLSIIPLFKNIKNKYPSEASMKYFIAQAMGSSLFLFSIIIYFIKNMPLSAEPEITELILISTALLLKMGAAPFHFWLPEVTTGLNWMSNFILLTWQKIAPMVLLSYQIHKHILFFSIIIIVSSMISGLQGLNQICLRKIMAYSSINHVSWMISSLLNSVSIFQYYFITYCFINMNIFIIFKKFNIFVISQLSSITSSKKKLKFFFMLNFLSLGGLPPFLGFLPKWLTINSMILNKHYTMMTILIIFTLLSLYFYMRITFSTFTLNSEESLIILFNKITYFHFFTNVLSLLGIISCSFIDTSF